MLERRTDSRGARGPGAAERAARIAAASAADGGAGRPRRRAPGRGAVAFVCALAVLLAACSGASVHDTSASRAPRGEAAGDARGPGGAIDTIDAPLDGLRGDPARGRRIVTNRQKGLCLLCHPGPFPEERFQGDLAPDLAGVGARLSEGQLRARVVDARRANPATIMPAYRRSAGFERVGGAWAGRALLEPQDVEDVVAFLATLRDVPAGAGR